MVWLLTDVARKWRWADWWFRVLINWSAYISNNVCWSIRCERERQRWAEREWKVLPIISKYEETMFRNVRLQLTTIADSIVFLSSRIFRAVVLSAWNLSNWTHSQPVLHSLAPTITPTDHWFLVCSFSLLPFFLTAIAKHKVHCHLFSMPFFTSPLSTLHISTNLICAFGIFLAFDIMYYSRWIRWECAVSRRFRSVRPFVHLIAMHFPIMSGGSMSAQLERSSTEPSPSTSSKSSRWFIERHYSLGGGDE